MIHRHASSLPFLLAGLLAGCIGAPISLGEPLGEGGGSAGASTGAVDPSASGPVSSVGDGLDGSTTDPGRWTSSADATSSVDATSGVASTSGTDATSSADATASTGSTSGGGDDRSSSSSDGGSGSGVALVRPLLITGFFGGDVFLDDDPVPLFSPAMLQGYSYTEVPAGSHSIRRGNLPWGAPDETFGPFMLEDDRKYTLVLFANHYGSGSGFETQELEVVLDDDEGIAMDQTRLHVIHVSDVMPWWPYGLEFDLLELGEPPTVLIDDLGPLESAVVEIPMGPHSFGLDPDDDLVPHSLFDIPDFGGGTLVNFYTDNAWVQGSDSRMVVQLGDGTVTTYSYQPPPSICGDGLIEGWETCDGDEFGGFDCTSFGYSGGSLLCILPDCEMYIHDCTP